MIVVANATIYGVLHPINDNIVFYDRPTADRVLAILCDRWELDEPKAVKWENNMIRADSWRGDTEMSIVVKLNYNVASYASTLKGQLELEFPLLLDILHADDGASFKEVCIAIRAAKEAGTDFSAVECLGVYPFNSHHPERSIIWRTHITPNYGFRHNSPTMGFMNQFSLFVQANFEKIQAGNFQHNAFIQYYATSDKTGKNSYTLKEENHD